MATNYPSSLDNATSLPYPNATDDTNSPSLAGGQDNQNDALIAIETLVGTNASQTDPTAQYNVLQATSSSASEWAKLTSNNVSSSTGTGSFVFATSPTISSPTISSPTISSPTITGSLGNISTGTITSSGLITGNGGATIGSTLTVNSGTTITYPTGSFSSVFLSNPYKFSVYRNASASLTSSTFNLVTFDTELFDTSSNYSTSSGKFTAPIDGFYQFNTTVGYGSTATRGILALYKNGTEYIRLIDSSGDTSSIGGIRSGATLLKLAAGDYIQVYIYVSSSETLNVGLNPIQTNFSGFLVGAT